MVQVNNQKWYKSTLSLNLVVTLLYYLFARLGFFVAIPPGNVSPIYPAAGIAVIGIILWGKRILPAVLLGSFFANWFFYLASGNERMTTIGIVIAFLMGIGPIIQTYVALKLFLHFGPKDKVLKTPKEIIVFASVVAPLSCIVAATWGNLIMLMFDVVSLEQLPLTWATWWIGDVAGVIVLSPLVLMGSIKKDILNVGHKSPMLNTVFAVLMTMMIALVGSWYMTSYIQGFKKIKIGISLWDTNPEYAKNVAAFKAELANKGFIEGKNVEFITETPRAKKNAVEEIIKKFIHQKVALIFVQTTPATLVTKNMTSSIPIVFSIVTYPVEANVIQDYASSGNNLVGTRNYVPMAKQYETLRKLGIQGKRFAFVHRTNEPNSTIQFHEFEELAKQEKIEIIEMNVSSKEEVFKLLESNRSRFDVVFSACDTLIQTGGEDEVIRFVTKYAYPDFACLASGVQKGSLIGNVADFVSIGSSAGELASKILRGEKPSSLKTQGFERDNIIINMKRAEELKIKVPNSVLSSANEVVR